MKKIAIGIVAAALTLAAPGTFTGLITDSECAKGDHTAMNMGPGAKCVTECIKLGAKYNLLAGDKVYQLSDQKAAEKFPAKKVTVTGTLDGKTIKVDSIAPAK